MIKWVSGLLVFTLSLSATLFVGFYVAIFLMGPYSDILPHWLHIPVGIFLLIIIIGIPALLGNKAYIFLKRRENKSK